MDYIYNFEEELKKYGLTSSTYEQVLQEISNKMSGISDIDWKEIVDKYDIKCHYDSVRKASQTIFGNYFVREYLKAKNITEKSTTLDDAKEVLGEQYIVKQQIHNDRLKLNKLKRDLHYNNYWVSLLIQYDEKSKPYLISMTDSAPHLKDAMEIIERERNNYRVLSAWVDVFDENNAKITIFHECYVNVVGKVERK